MMNKQVCGLAITAIALTILLAITLSVQQDRNTLKVPDGLAFSDFEGYDIWQDVAVSETEGSVKAILGNSTMISAYKEGIPDNGIARTILLRKAMLGCVRQGRPLLPNYSYSDNRGLQKLGVRSCNEPKKTLVREGRKPLPAPNRTGAEQMLGSKRKPILCVTWKRC
jgi:hypothetical protein